mgnify:CR=1
MVYIIFSASAILLIFTSFSPSKGTGKKRALKTKPGTTLNYLKAKRLESIGTKKRKPGIFRLLM